MATRIELPPQLVKQMMDVNIHGLKRQVTTAKTEMVREAYKHELDQITKAQATLSEIK